jgi:hypothetical protein
VEDYGLDGLDALSQETVYVCFVTLKDDLHMLDKRSDEEFLGKAEGVNVLGDVQSFAARAAVGKNISSTPGASRRAARSGRFWIARGIMGFHGTPPLAAVAAMFGAKPGTSIRQR